MARGEVVVDCAYGALPQEEGGSMHTRKSKVAKLLAVVCALVVVACIAAHFSKPTELEAEEDSPIVEFEKKYKSVQLAEASAKSTAKSAASRVTTAASTSAHKASTSVKSSTTTTSATGSASAQGTGSTNQNAQIAELKHMVDAHVHDLQVIANEVEKHASDCSSVNPLLDQLEDHLGTEPADFSTKIAALNQDGRDLVEAYTHVAIHTSIHHIMAQVDAKISHCFDGGNEESHHAAQAPHELSLPDILKGKELSKMTLSELNGLLSRLEHVHSLIQQQAHVAQQVHDHAQESAEQARDMAQQVAHDEAGLTKEDGTAKADVAHDTAILNEHVTDQHTEQELVHSLEEQIREHEQQIQKLDNTIIHDHESLNHDRDVQNLVEAQMHAVASEVSSRSIGANSAKKVTGST